METARFDHRKYRAFQPIIKTDRRWPDRMITEAPQWCSVDLRDGNQALVEPMNAEQKLRLWELLISIGFTQVEVGFPSASSHDFAFLRKLIEERPYSRRRDGSGVDAGQAGFDRKDLCCVGWREARRGAFLQ